MSATSPSQIAPGARIDHFQIERLLGKGGMGAVYLAEDINLGRKVAIKVLPPALVAEEGYRERFYREARAAARVQHPNIVGIYHLGETGGLPYFAMEYVEGTPLDEVLRERGAMAPSLAVGLVLQVLQGLAHAQHQGVIHRDLKPANLVLGKDRRVRILDFGLARAEGSKSLTQTGAVMGTPDFMAPEQGLGKKVTMTADVYAVGVILFQFLTGRLPFVGDSALEVMMAHVQQPPPPLEQILPHLPRALTRVISRCLEKDPAARYQDYAELTEDLQRAHPDLEGIPPPDQVPTPSSMSSAATVPSGDSLPSVPAAPGKGVTLSAGSQPGQDRATSISSPAGTPPALAPATPPAPPGYQPTLAAMELVHHCPELGRFAYARAVLRHCFSFWLHPFKGRNDLVLAVRDPEESFWALYRTLAILFVLLSLPLLAPPAALVAFMSFTVAHDQVLARLSAWWTQGRPGAPNRAQWRLLWLMTASPLLLRPWLHAITDWLWLFHLAVQGWFTLALPHQELRTAAPLDRSAATAPPPGA